MKSRVAVAVLLVSLAANAGACSMRNWDPNDLIENTPVMSANGRYTAVVRWWPDIPDFKSERAGKVLHFDDPPTYDVEGNEFFESAPRPELVTTALYESGVLLHEFAIKQDSFTTVLVPDSGRYLVAYRSFGGGGCYPRAEETDPLLTIYTRDGAQVATVHVNDVLTSWDVQQMNSGFHRFAVSTRSESDRHEVVVVSIDDRIERRIDLPTGALLDPKNDIYPKPHVWATALEGWSEKVPSLADCKLSDVVQLDSARLLERASLKLIPEFPSVAARAHIRGKVYLAVLIDEAGQVVCTQTSQFPFGIGYAADAGVRQWRFRPLLVNGKAVKYAGVIVMHFEDLDDATWEAMNR